MSVKEMILEIRNIKMRLASGALGLIDTQNQLVALMALQDSLIKALLASAVSVQLDIRKVA